MLVWKGIIYCLGERTTKVCDATKLFHFCSNGVLILVSDQKRNYVHSIDSIFATVYEHIFVAGVDY